MDFEQAADAIVTGDADRLAQMLKEHPDLAFARSTRAHAATLLHYLGANGVEEYRQKSPRNAVRIAKMLLEAGAEVNAIADIYGKITTLGLVASSIHPKQAGVQIPLLQTLLDYGALIDGVPGVGSPLIAALHNGRKEAAEFLAGHGARLDLEGAAGVGRLDIVKSLNQNVPRAQIALGFLWACEYGRISVIDFLLTQDIDLRAGGNTGLSGLHWAVVGGQMEAIQLLLERGAPLEAVNKYGGTALGQAIWCVINGDPAADYFQVIELLLRAGAQIDEDSRAWLVREERLSGVLALRFSNGS